MDDEGKEPFLCEAQNRLLDLISILCKIRLKSKIKDFSISLRVDFF